MFFWLKQTLPRQLGFMLFCGIAAVLCKYVAGYSPLLRFSLSLVQLGILAGLLNLLFLGFLLLLGLYFDRSHLRNTLLDLRKRTSRLESGTRLGAAITTASGEEFLLRGLVFGLFMDSHFVIALCLTVGLTSLGYYHGRRDWYWVLLRGLEACWYAILFYRHRSLALIVLARLMKEVAANFVLLSPRTKRILDEKRLTWGLLYDRPNTSDGTFRSV